MRDIELLELAAKAYGLDWENVISDGGSFVENGRVWNPLTDDGDALRLAVSLKMDVQQDNTQVTVWYFSGYSDASQETESVIEHGRILATRLAIVRAAAEIGKSL